MVIWIAMRRSLDGITTYCRTGHLDENHNMEWVILARKKANTHERKPNTAKHQITTHEKCEI
jgi:hypothetical protein